MRSHRVTGVLLGTVLAVGLAAAGVPAAATAPAVPIAPAVPAAPAAPGNQPTLPIEQEYYAPGPWAVTAAPALGCCDSSGAAFDVWYPTDLGRDGFRHPIVTWGNGTGAVPEQYAFLLAHLASWGFVVVATENVATGSGREIRDAAAWLAAQHDDPSSVFHGHLDPARVGAMGHSQGASGAVNAMAGSAGVISTAIPLEIPAQLLCSDAATCADTRELSGGSIFLVNGTADALISPSWQPLPWQLSGLQSNSAYYEATPASVAKVWATLRGPDHNDVQGQPDCAAASQPCVNGVYGYLGYPTAWLMDRLQGDTRARQAFVTGTGEIFRETTNWTNQASTVEDPARAAAVSAYR